MKEVPFRIYPETETEKWRVETFWDKEPETIAWIDSMRSGESMLDIGANIGLYSLYAAKRGLYVVAVEPHPANYMRLAINQRKHNRSLQMKTVFGAVGKNDELGDFYFEKMEAGSSDGGLKYRKSQSQHVRIFTVEYLNKWYGPFDHIKVDVDGGELDVVKGMDGCLSTIKSCLIETGPHYRAEIVKKMHRYGLTEWNTFNVMQPHSRTRRAKEGIRVENIIFTRTE